MRKTVFIILIVTLAVLVTCLISTVAVNVYVDLNAADSVYSSRYDLGADGYDCIIVLGAGVRGDTPSDMLEDRLLTAIELYNGGVAPKLLMSGDHGSEDYDEVNVMKSYAMETGVPSEDIFMDHAGFSTYESIYRAKEVFGVKKAVIVSQSYHLPRALHISLSLGLDAVAVGSDRREYQGEIYREVREYFAVYKDFFKSVIKPSPKILGESIPISGNGDITNDK